MRPSWADRFDAYVSNNVTATQQLLESAVRRGTERFVYAELGFEPTTGLEEGLAAEFEWMASALRPLPA